MKAIVPDQNPVLRQIASAVPIEDIGSAYLKTILKDMSESLASCDDGVALAAPQIGVPLRIFIVSKKLFKDGEGDAIFINPTITKLSKKKVILDEGCLSVRHIYGKTKRSDKATVQAYDEIGNRFNWNGAGLMAQIFQHEVDHLDGILFIDHATDLHEQEPINSSHD
ncbi:MAG: peptide deformylase [Patescibacteria group bacterium]|nr:peptide deformylase [Patescibacteria group bacterium]